MNRSGAFFDIFADTFDTFYDGKRSRFMRWVDQRYRSDIFVRFEKTFDSLGDLSGKRVLDIGCGSGSYVAETLKRGAAHVTGIDPAPRMLALARYRVAKLGMNGRATLVEGYFPQMCPHGRFDFAIVMGVMDYVEDAPAFVGSLLDVISERAVLSFPSTHWFRTPFRKVRYTARRCPVYFYTRAKISKLMEQAGVKHYDLMKIPGAGMDFIVCIKTQTGPQNWS
jgi:SAM-dependent methyltransferase